MQKKLNKICLSFFIFPLLTQAQTHQDNRDIQVNVITVAGCILNYPPVSFGVVSEKTAWIDGKNRVTQNISVSCSKGVYYTLTGDVANASGENSILNIKKTARAHPLFGVSPDNPDYLGFVVISPACGMDNDPNANLFSSGKNPISGVSKGITDIYPVCFSLKGMSGFPGYGVKDDNYMGKYTFNVAF